MPGQGQRARSRVRRHGRRERRQCREPFCGGDALSRRQSRRSRLVLDETMRHETLRRALDRANDTVFGLAGRQPEFRGMGTTLVGAFVQGGSASIMNVGDSRAYIMSGGMLHQISEDHSYVEEMRRLGQHQRSRRALPSAEKSDHPGGRRGCDGGGRPV
ncbi:MAG: protein phosphatase 2C domain-containing protein [Butyricicoccaceae bacterium]